MSRIVVVPNSNYKVQVSTGGTITLDTQAGGASYGTVLIKGNLDVLGSTTTIETTNSAITDNIIQINSGDTSSTNGITVRTAGIEIERGNPTYRSPAQILFNEDISHWDEFSTTLTTVKITGTAGQFSCDTTPLTVGSSVTITGAINAGSISGYTSPKTYYIVSVSGSTVTINSTTASTATVTLNASTSLTAGTAITTGNSISGGGLSANTTYYVAVTTSNSTTVTLAATLGGAAINWGTSGGTVTSGVATAGGISAFTLSATYSGPAITTTSSSGTNLTATIVASTGADLAGVFQLKTVDGKLNGLALETITNGGNPTDIVFDMRNTTKVLTVANSINYANYVIRDNDIPTYKFLQNYVSSTYTNGTPGNALVSNLQYPSTVGSTIGTANTSIQAGSSTITFQAQVASSPTTIGTMTNAGFFLGNVRIGGNTTQNTISGTGGNNLVLTAASSAAVEVNGYLMLDNLVSVPTYTSSGAELYASSTIGAGKTGIYFVNSANYNDELIAKNRALLLSILF